MVSVSGVQCSMQSKFEWVNPVENLDDDHLSKLIVFLVQDFKQEKTFII